MDTALKLFVTKCILHYSAVYGLDPKLTASVVYKETLKGTDSHWVAMTARRYEPSFFDRYIRFNKLSKYIPRFISNETERRDLASSWGYMQIMGATARDFGFKGESLGLLFLPWINIEYGCKVLSNYIKRTGSEFNGVRMYNGSLKNPSTLAYAEEVFSIFNQRKYKEKLGEI